MRRCKLSYSRLVRSLAWNRKARRNERRSLQINCESEMSEATTISGGKCERVRTLIHARVNFYEGSSSADCQIKDLSSTGARLSISAAVALPRDFLLEIPSLNHTHKAALRWRIGELAGVQFIDDCAADSKASQGIFDLTVDELRAEVTSLRQQKAEFLARLTELGDSAFRDNLLRKAAR